MPSRSAGDHPVTQLQDSRIGVGHDLAWASCVPCRPFRPATRMYLYMYLSMVADTAAFLGFKVEVVSARLDGAGGRKVNCEKYSNAVVLTRSTVK